MSNIRNIRNAVLAAVLAPWLLMGAMCSSTDIQTIITQVQQGTAAACAFIPTAETIVAIIGLNNPALASAAAIADAICKAIPPAPAAGGKRASAPPVINNVVIHGYYVDTNTAL